MIARIDGGGLLPIQIAAKFAEACFDEARTVDPSTFAGAFTGAGFEGRFKLVDGDQQYGMRWFKRRGRAFAFYRLDESLFGYGLRAAGGGHPYERHGDSSHQAVSYADGYIAGLPRKLEADVRRTIEAEIYTDIDSLLYA